MWLMQLKSQIFSFYVILINLKGHTWPVATVLAQCWPNLRKVIGQPQVTEVLKQPRCPGQPADSPKACVPPGQFTDLPFTSLTCFFLNHLLLVENVHFLVLRTLSLFLFHFPAAVAAAKMKRNKNIFLRIMQVPQYTLPEDTFVYRRDCVVEWLRLPT